MIAGDPPTFATVPRNFPAPISLAPAPLADTLGVAARRVAPRTPTEDRTMTPNELRSIADQIATVGDGCLDSPDVSALIYWTEQTLRLLADTDDDRDAWRAAEHNAIGAAAAASKDPTIIGTAPED